MDASVKTDVSSTSTSEKDEKCNVNFDDSHSPSSTSEQEVNKQGLQPQNDDSQVALGKVPVDQNLNSDTTTNEPMVERSSSGADIQKENKKSKKNVVFPNDHAIVKSYLEPPDPWKNVPDWRTEDLLRAYKKGCEKHGTKPLNKILQQLQCIENVGERYEILSLKGERLDLKQCESLEEIFKHVRFRCVDVEATHLDDEMAVALFEMVEYYESACKLNISFNKGIGPRGWMSCSKLVRRTPCLTFIDARNCDLNERVIPIMGRALRMGCFLQRLHLQSAGLAGRALVILVAALKINETLKELFLGDNKFMPTDGVQIGNLLKYNHKLELLDLRNNHLQDVGIGHVCDGLAEQCLETGLLTLVLWNNQITFQGMSAIGKSLTTAENIETLNLGHNPITNEGIHILKDGLLKSKGLLKLGLSGTKVTCEGAVALAEVIADNTRLVRVDLQENEIKTAGLMALSLALRVNESITRLDIDRDTKKESGVKDYADQQKRLQKEINNLLERNRDLMHKREEEQRQIEIRNQENARKLQEAACDISIEESHEYLPSGDSIHRPKLLFLPLPQMCPEHELDSPVLGEELIFDTTPQGQGLHLAPPSSTDLLSPQYCANPKATAKKIFSVTRVTSPTGLSPKSSEASNGFPFPKISSPVSMSSPGSGLDSVMAQSIPHLVPPLPSVNLPSLTTPIPLTMNMHTGGDEPSPSTLQRVIEQQTLVSYIKQIVDDSDINTVTDTKKELCDSSDEKDESAKNCSNNAGIETQSTEVSQVSEPESVKNPIDQSDVSSKAESTAESEIANGPDNDFKTEEDKSADEIKNVVESSKQSEPKTVEDVESSKETVEETGPKQEEDEKVEVVEGTSGETSAKTDQIKDDSELCDSENIPKTGNINETVFKNTSQGEALAGTANDCGSNSESDLSSNTDAENTSSSQTKYSTDLDCDFQKVQNTEPKSLSEFDMPSVIDVPSKGNADDVNGKIDNDVDKAEKSPKKVEVDDTVTGNDGKPVKSSENGNTGVTEQENGDSEAWNTVNKSDIEDNSLSGSNSANTGSNNKPDFHTNLTFNGLRQELASLIDEEAGNSVTNVSVVNGVVHRNSDSAETYTQNGAETTSDWLDTTTMDMSASS